MCDNANDSNESDALWALFMVNLKKNRLYNSFISLLQTVTIIRIIRVLIQSRDIIQTLGPGDNHIYCLVL